MKSQLQPERPAPPAQRPAGARARLARLLRVDWIPLCWGLTHARSELLPLRRRTPAADGAKAVERKAP